MKEKILNDLLTEWKIFRDEELSKLTTEDKKHPLNFNKHVDTLINSLPYKNRAYATKMLDAIYDDFLDFCNYYTDKYYKAGFGDCLNLVIMSLGGNHYGS